MSLSRDAKFFYHVCILMQDISKQTIHIFDLHLKSYKVESELLLRESPP